MDYIVRKKDKLEIGDKVLCISKWNNMYVLRRIEIVKEQGN